jgi:uncharacterized protein YeaO (DUF488 family)
MLCGSGKAKIQYSANFRLGRSTGRLSMGGSMPIKTKRWNDPAEADDGLRVLICRFRPRGVSKQDESWDIWHPELGPSKELHGAVYTESASKIPWPRYRRQYLDEQRKNKTLVQSLAALVRAGQTLTLLCSSACVRESRCHRSILKELIEQELAAPASPIVSDEYAK